MRCCSTLICFRGRLPRRSALVAWAVVLIAIAQPCVAVAENWAAQSGSQLLDPGQPLDARRQTEAVVPTVPGILQGPRTLAECVAQAERMHPRIRAAQAAVEMARGKAVQARLYPNPVVAGFSPQMAGSYSQWSGTVAQDLVTAGKLRLSQQAALREVQKAQFELTRARFDVLRDVRRSFYLLLVAQRRQEIFNQLLQIATRSYDIGRQLAEAGEGTKADVLFWNIERDRAEVRLLNAGVDIETGRRELAAAMAVPREEIGPVAGDLLASLPDFDLAMLQEQVVQLNAQPRAAAADVARAQWALERAVVEPIPNVNLLGGYQRNVNFPAQDQGLAQVMMEVPLFDRNQGNIRAAQADIAGSRAALRTIELDLATQTAQAVNAYRTARRLVAWYEESILPKARETLQLTQMLYGKGEVTFLSLLQAQRTLTETELAFVEAQAERWSNAVAIADLLQLEVFPPTPAAPAAVEVPVGPDERVPAAAPANPAAVQPLPQP